tara:strand:+ start:843 stop:1136 length:294 start_codon:yes stop_codon:yes gene_type:complete
MDDKVFVDGMLVKPGPENEEFKWVKAKLSIKLDEFGAWVAAQKKADSSIEWINIEIKEGRSGKWYAERNMWKPSADQPARQPARQVQQPVPNDDIPW